MRGPPRPGRNTIDGGSGSRQFTGQCRPAYSGRVSEDDSSSAEDVLEQGGRRFPVLNWRPSRGAALLGTAGLLAGLAAGYAAGEWRAGSSARPPQRPQAATSPTAPAAAVTPALTQSTATCATQIGRELQLGVQITNQSGTALTLRRVEPVLPMGGLSAVSQQWAPCGTLPTGQDQPGGRLASGASTWFTITFKVLLGCPRPLPVQFTVDYDWHGQRATASLPGFVDLGEVPYTGCPAD